MKKIILFFIILIQLSTAYSHIINTENGKISGREYENYFAYKGIKYATADRFSLPRPIEERWNDVKEFKEYKESCAQYSHLTYDFEGVEDCLFLNVFVPKKVLESEKPVPVIFFIHGGAFMFGGGGHYFPDNFMDNGKMILVTINYRLGILGFLSTEDEILPGNLGLKDQVQALKWVQRNIHAFNGDPNMVTLSGFSAGGASVQLHYLSPQSNGLFKNGISHSGVVLNPWVMMENATAKSYQVAQYMNCPYDDHKIMVECLKQKPVRELVSLLKKFQPFLYNPFSPFGVVVETSHESAFLSENPKILLERGKFNQRPWLLSQAKDEGLYPGAEFYSKVEILKEIDENWEELAPYILHYNEETDDKEKKRKASRMIREFYMGDKKICRENFASFDDILSDSLFKYNAFEAIQLQSKYSPSFFYHFAYKSLAGVVESLGKTNDFIGIPHGEDIFLIFTSDIRSIEFSKEEKRMAQNLINMYYEFAVNNLPKFDMQVIHQSHPDAIQYLDIFTNEKYAMKMQNEKFGNVKFWKKIEDILHSREHMIDEL